MHTHLFIFGFGFTAQFLAKKLLPLEIQITATTRGSVVQNCGSKNGDAMITGNNSLYQLINFYAKDLEKYFASVSHILVSTPPVEGIGDPVLANFSELIAKYAHNIRWLGYLSSTGVYGDHNGGWVNESSKPKSLGKQGKLRLSAEKEWTAFAQKNHLHLHIFRLAGIYGPQRNALSRILAGKKETIIKEGHFFSRIHVEDLTSIIFASMQNPRTDVSIYNVADDEPAPSYVVDDYAASLLHLPALVKTPYEVATLSPMLKEFYLNNKLVSNAKIKKELISQLAYPTYREGLKQLRRDLR